MAGGPKRMAPRKPRKFADFNSVSKKLAARGLEASKSRFNTDRISTRQMIAARIDPRTHKLPWCSEAEKAAYDDATRLQYRAVFKTAGIFQANKRKQESEKAALGRPRGPVAPVLRRTLSNQQFSDDELSDESCEEAVELSQGSDDWTVVFQRASHEWVRMADESYAVSIKNWVKEVCKSSKFRTHAAIEKALPASVQKGAEPFDILKHGAKLPMWDYFCEVEATDQLLPFPQRRYGYLPVLVRQYSATRSSAAFTERMNSMGKNQMNDKQAALGEVELRNKVTCSMSTGFVDYAVGRDPSSFSGMSFKVHTERAAQRYAEAAAFEGAAPDLGSNTFVLDENLNLANQAPGQDPNGEQAWLVDFFVCEVTDEAIKHSWIALHLPASADPQTTLHFCKYVGCHLLRDIEIVAKESDGGGVPDLVFDHHARRADSLSTQQKSASIRKWLPERGGGWRSAHTVA